MARRRFAYVVMTVPALLLFMAFHTLPAAEGIFYAFTNWDGIGQTYHMVGWKNFINLFKDENISNAYGFTFKFAIVTTIIVNALSLLIALALNTAIKWKTMFRGLYFLPNVLSVLIISYIFNYLFNNAIPQIGEKLGIDALTISILGSEQWAWVGIVIVVVWQAIAFNSILYLAGLQTIPRELYEASSLDGASKWHEFWKLTFPLIAPFFTINMVLSFKSFLQVFDQIIAMTGGGPGRATQSIAHLIYMGGFSGGEFAFQSANSVIYFLIIVLISLVQIAVLRKREVDL